MSTTTKPTPEVDAKIRTITLTYAAPVRIRDAEWPIIAEIAWDAGDPVERIWIKVRRHADGRVIVYGGDTVRYTGPSDRRGGELLELGENLATAVHRVGRHVGAPEAAVHELCRNLPPVEL